MKISLDWLSDFVTWIEKDPDAIANRITLASAEVEEVERQGALLDHCCVGKILTVEKHPNADRLSVCSVETDRGEKTVVCGGTNVYEGMLVAFAHVGATVRWHGEETVTLEPVKIRGVASEGMICAAEELDLAEMFPSQPEDGERPIIDLSRSQTDVETPRRGVSTGRSLRDALGLTDTILHINNTAITMRPDLFSHIGFARECVALGLAKWKKRKENRIDFPLTKPPFQMHVECMDLVPRYLACMITIDATGETPDWMKRRLIATGWRPVSLPVDITNYVATETGMPLHSFDADDIRGDVHLRLSKRKESIETLDHVVRALPDGAFVLSDDDGIFDLLGIMGGLRSSTKDSTKNIYLHAAALDPKTIRKTILATNHRTEAATVYEKGVQPITAETGFYRALELFLELVPGAKIASALQSSGSNGSPPAISVSPEHVRDRIGVDIDEKDITHILKDLEFTVRKGPKKGTFTVVPPLHRLRDIEGEHDIIEEVGRIYGYDKVPETMPEAVLRIPHRDNRLHAMRDQLKAEHFVEIVPLSFVSSQLLKKTGLDPAEAVEVKNPLGDETALLQTSTLPHLLAHAQKNLLLAGDTLRSFQCSHVFHKDEPERMELGLLHASRVQTDLLHDPFLQLKEELSRTIRAANETIDIEAAKDIPAMAHPGRAAVIRHNGDIVGYLFELHPQIRTAFDIAGRAAAAMIDLTALLATKPHTTTVQPLPAFPPIVYDVTLTRTHKEHIGHLLQEARRASELLEDVVVHDLYSKNVTSSPSSALRTGSVEKGLQTYNVTLRFTYRSPEKTLTEQEAKAAHEKVLAAIS